MTAQLFDLNAATLTGSFPVDERRQMMRNQRLRQSVYLDGQRVEKRRTGFALAFESNAMARAANCEETPGLR